MAHTWRTYPNNIVWSCDLAYRTCLAQSAFSACHWLTQVDSAIENLHFFSTHLLDVYSLFNTFKQEHSSLIWKQRGRCTQLRHLRMKDFAEVEEKIIVGLLITAVSCTLSFWILHINRRSFKIPGCYFHQPWSRKTSHGELKILFSQVFIIILKSWSCLVTFSPRLIHSECYHVLLLSLNRF